MQRLPDVLLQLLMQMMHTAADRLRLARCSSQMMHAADSPAAWRHCGMLRCSAGRALPVPLSSCRLLRHLRSIGGVSLRWDRMYGLTDADCDRILASFSSIAELDCRGCETKRGCDDERISSARLQRMLAQPALAALRSLSLPAEWPTDVDVMQQLHELPLLSHLHIACGIPLNGGSLLWPALLHLPALTSLSTARILIVPPSAESDLASQVALPPIVHLRLDRAMFFPSNFEQLFGRQPRLRSLQSLSLVRWAAHRTQQPAWSVCEHLHTLHLRQVVNLAAMLPALRFLKPLRLLTISPVPTDPQSLDSLIELLLRCPELRVTIFVVRPPFGPFVCPADVASLYSDQSPETRTRLAPVADRVSVRPDEPERR